MTELVMRRENPLASGWTARVALGIAGALGGLTVGAIVVAVIATQLFGYRVLTVSSGSMAPAIEAGDLVVVRPAAMKDVHPGDIVLFDSGGDGIPTIHRVAGINELELNVTDAATGAQTTTHDYRLVTKGDANADVDPGEVGARAFRGELWLSVPHAGAVLGEATEAVFVTIAAVVVLTWIAWEIWQRRVRE